MVAQKIREKERKWEKLEKSEKAESFPPILLLSKKFIDYSATGAYILPSQEKLQKKPKSKVFTRDKMGRKQKRKQQSTSQTGSRKEQWLER